MNAFKFIACNLMWVSFIGLIMLLTKNSPNTEIGHLIIGFLYMPSPLFFTLIFDEFNVQKIVSKYGLSFKKWKLKSSILWSVLFYATFVCSYILLTFVLGNLLKIPGIGHVMYDYEEFLKFSGETSLPITNNIYLLYGISFLNSIFVGLTLNALFAFGEELGWRGYLWKELCEIKTINSCQSKLLIGVVWGIWHAPLIFQGYNFPEQPIIGIGYMLISTIPLTFILTDAVSKYETVIVAAFIHGLMNATAFLAVVIPDSQPPLGTIVGIVSVCAMLTALKVANKLIS